MVSNRERKKDSFLKKPYFEGGLTAMRAHIKKHLKYPESALKEKIEGTVILKYQIDHKGNVIATKVVSGLNKECDIEAQRVVKLFKFKVPKIPRKLKVKFTKSIRVNFKIPPKPKSKNQTTTTSLSYKLVPSQKESDATSRNKSSGNYSYIIKY